MLRWLTSDLVEAISGSQLMPDHPLVVGAAGGSIGSLLFGLARQLLEDPYRYDPALHSVKERLCGLDLDLGDRQVIQVFLLGLLAGILLGPLIDLFWICRERWRRFVLARVGASPLTSTRTLYKVIWWSHSCLSLRLIGSWLSWLTWETALPSWQGGWIALLLWWKREDLVPKHLELEVLQWFPQLLDLGTWDKIRPRVVSIEETLDAIWSVNLHGFTLCAGTSLERPIWILHGSAIGLLRWKAFAAETETGVSPYSLDCHLNEKFEQLFWRVGSLSLPPSEWIMANLDKPRDHLVNGGRETDLQFRVGRIQLIGLEAYAAVVCIAEVSGQLLICVPNSVWDKKKDRRFLPIFQEADCSFSGSSSLFWSGECGRNPFESMDRPSCFGVKEVFGFSGEGEVLKHFHEDGEDELLPYAESLVSISPSFQQRREVYGWDSECFAKHSPRCWGRKTVCFEKRPGKIWRRWRSSWCCSKRCCKT